LAGVVIFWLVIHLFCGLENISNNDLDTLLTVIVGRSGGMRNMQGNTAVRV